MISPLAYVDPRAKIGDNVVVEPFAMIHGNVEVGDGCWIGSHSTLMDGSRLGKNVNIFPGACISGFPQSLKFKDEETHVFIGDNTVIRECVTISRGTTDKFKTVIGANCLIMAYSHLGHDCIVGDNVIIINNVQVAGHCTVDDWAVIGGSSAIHQFTKIGAHTMIAGGSLIRKDIPPFIKAGREPMVYAGVNSIGLRRRGFTNQKIKEIQDIYRIIYLNGNNVSKALGRIEMECPPSDERDEITNFIRTSERGIMKGFTRE